MGAAKKSQTSSKNSNVSSVGKGGEGWKSNYQESLKGGMRGEESEGSCRLGEGLGEGSASRSSRWRDRDAPHRSCGLGVGRGTTSHHVGRVTDEGREGSSGLGEGLGGTSLRTGHEEG